MRRLIAVIALGLACASPGMPPGGPVDVAAPQIVSVVPDSGAVGVKPKEVLFQFDEVVSERPPGVTSLSDLFLISPRDGSPDASWHREAIGVKPPHGWRPNTAYTVIMQRGLADIRGNVRNTGATTFFSTGSAVPRTKLTGNVFDWVTGSPASGALIESFVTDSIHAYVALADSNGIFTLQHLPPARYIVRAYVDRNKNHAIDTSEPWDSVTVTLADSARSDLLIFVHDTVPPRIREVRAIDSLTLQVTFDKPVDPKQTLTAGNFAVIGPDSVAVPIASAGPAARDTVAAKPVMSRPVPILDVTIKLRRPLAQKTAYRVRAIGIRGLLGRVGDSEQLFTPPAPPPPTPAAKQPVTPPPPVRPPEPR
ncbi:MAG: Ig-like domain-containing protein [Gemmatimonadaceae bacterium]